MHGLHLIEILAELRFLESIAKGLLVVLTLLERIGAETLETEAANNRKS